MLIWNQFCSPRQPRAREGSDLCGDTRITYGQFAEDAEALARKWLVQGLEPGDRIAFHMRNGLELATAYYACLAAGFVAVPINNRLIPEEIEWVLEHSGARAYFSQRDLQVRPDGILRARVAQVAALQIADPADRPALLLYTSGTTAHPKGVTHSQRTLAGNVSYMKAWGLTADDHTLLFTPMVHASGAIMHLISSLSIGAAVTIIPVFDAATVLDAWEHNGTTFT